MHIPILLKCTDEDIPYLPMLKPFLLGKCKLFISNTPIITVTEVVMDAQKRGCKHVAVTSQRLLELLLPEIKVELTLDNYAGSIITVRGIEFLILNPTSHLVSVPYGRFLYERYFSKFLHPERWLQLPDFRWELFQERDVERYLDIFNRATFIASDIETGSEEARVITCAGYSAVTIDSASNTFRVTTIVVPCTSEFNLAFIRRANSVSSPKIFQNGKYDNSYFLRYSASVQNYSGDTATAFHSWYSELPKRLDFITSFMLRNTQYWKGESKSLNLYDYYQYNARDCFNTAMSWLSLLIEMPDWAWVNYHQEFPLLFPCLHAEMIGIKRDPEQIKKLSAHLDASIEQRLDEIRTMVGNKNYNPNSWQQTVRLFAVLGSSDIKSSDVKARDKVSYRHPINKRILGDIENIRKDRKLVSSYLKESAHWNGRFLYAINPHGTDTGRMASKESHFWCGLQIQNIPRDRKDGINIKSAFISDAGFLFGECDKEQAETRYTAYLSGDTKLIEAVEDKSKDFHGRNASSFFGVPYDKIVKTTFEEELKEYIHKTLDKILRDLSKRTNHGANYNMGAYVLVETMGIENVLRARTLLNLPVNWSLKQVTQYLLDQFDKTYPVLRSLWYDKVVRDVTGQHMLVGPTDWTRYCFADPTKNKHYLNSYVAHPPQSLSAMMLNKAWLRVFKEVQQPNYNDFKLHAQIHDSIFFQYRIGREDLAWKVKECMHNPIEITDTFGIKRTLIVPAALKGNATRWSEIEDLRKAA